MSAWEWTGWTNWMVIVKARYAKHKRGINLATTRCQSLSYAKSWPNKTISCGTLQPEAKHFFKQAQLSSWGHGQNSNSKQVHFSASSLVLDSPSSVAKDRIRWLNWSSNWNRQIPYWSASQPTCTSLKASASPVLDLRMRWGGRRVGRRRRRGADWPFASGPLPPHKARLQNILNDNKFK